MNPWGALLVAVVGAGTLFGGLALAFPDYASLLLWSALGMSVGWTLAVILLQTVFAHYRRVSDAEFALMVENNRRIAEQRIRGLKP